FVLHSSAHHLDLHSFPTRRSSDLNMQNAATEMTGIVDATRGSQRAIVPACKKPSAMQLVSYAAPIGAAIFLWMPTITILPGIYRSEEHTSELQSRFDLVCRLLLEK